MKELEMKIDAMMRFCAAASAEQRAQAQSDVLRLMNGEAGRKGMAFFDAEAEAEALLAELGTPAHIKGYRYLIDALCRVTKDERLLESITKDLYPLIAARFESTPVRVERSMRHAIEITWDRGDLDVLQHYFGNSISAFKGKPTNSEFVARAGVILRARMRGAAGRIRQ